MTELYMLSRQKDIGDICTNPITNKDTIFEEQDFYYECMRI